jgi:hypothetical protein
MSGHGAATAADTADTARAWMAEGWPPSWPLPADPSPATIAATFAWLDQEQAAGQRAASVAVPLFGSDEWAVLPDAEPAKWVAVFQAAASWYRDYTTIGDRIRRELREELERFEAYALERDRAHYAPLRQAAQDAAAGIERRDRQAAHAAARARIDRSGPQIIADAYASWGLPMPADSSPRTLEVA